MEQRWHGRINFEACSDLVRRTLAVSNVIQRASSSSENYSQSARLVVHHRIAQVRLLSVDWVFSVDRE